MTLSLGLLALGLILVSIYFPAQLVFESKPYARLVLSSGHMDSWSAGQLGLDEEDFQLAKDQYTEYLKIHKLKIFDDDSDSDEDDEVDSSLASDENRAAPIPPIDLDNDDADDINDVDKRRKRQITRRAVDDDNDGDADVDDDDNAAEEAEDDDVNAAQKNDNVASVSSSDLPGGVDSDPYEDMHPEAVLELILKDKPLKQTIGLGLFKGHRCIVQQDFREMCEKISVQAGLDYMKEEASFMDSDINMSMWNNLRVEAIFTAVGCAIGLICLLATLRPCCANERIPVNIGALAFAISGCLIYVPIVRLMMIRGDFEQNLKEEINVTTNTKFSWSLFISGMASPCALLAALIILRKSWVRETKRIYRKLVGTRKPNRGGEKLYTINGHEERVKMVPVREDSFTQITSDGSSTGNDREMVTLRKD